MTWLQFALIIGFIFLLFIVTDYAYTQRIQKLEADIRSLKQNSNKMREAMLGVAQWMKLREEVDDA